MPLTMAANVWVWACDGFWNRGLRITSIIEFATSDVFLLGSLFFFFISLFLLSFLPVGNIYMLGPFSCDDCCFKQYIFGGLVYFDLGLEMMG